MTPRLSLIHIKFVCYVDQSFINGRHTMRYCGTVISNFGSNIHLCIMVYQRPAGYDRILETQRGLVYHGQPLALHRDAVCLCLQQRNRLFNPEIYARTRYARGRQPGACLTRTNGSKSCSNIWSRCDDQPLGRHQERQPHCGDGR